MAQTAVILTVYVDDEPPLPPNEDVSVVLFDDAKEADAWAKQQCEAIEAAPSYVTGKAQIMTVSQPFELNRKEG